MGLAAIQAALARLSVDPAFRQRFFADPMAAGNELGLDCDESQNLARIPRKQVEQFAQSLHRKRRDQVRRAIPLAARAMAGRFVELFEQYAVQSTPRGAKADLDDAIGFVEAIGRRNDPLEPAWAFDLARYELAWRQATRSGRVPLLRKFRFPVGRLATGQVPDPIAPRTTLAFWWKPTRGGNVRHIVISMPGRGRRRK
jgi:hypothetical protein